MDSTKQHQEQQQAKQLQRRISSFIRDFQIGTLLNNLNLYEEKGNQRAPPLPKENYTYAERVEVKSIDCEGMCAFKLKFN